MESRYETLVLALQAETPLHPGSAQCNGALDYPLQRERTSGFPFVLGSGIKGALRAEALFKKLAPADLELLFGGTDSKSGAMAYTDARLLLFPVRSASAVFTWVTCPQVLSRLRRDLALDSKTDLVLPGFSELVAGQAWVVPNTPLLAGESLVLEEYRFDAKAREELAALAAWLSETFVPAAPEFDFWRSKLKTSLVVVADEDFKDFVTMSTEVTGRITVDPEKRAAADSSVRYEEYLPADSILYSMLLAAPQAGHAKSATDCLALIDKLELQVLRLGANQSIGKGLMRVSLHRPRQARILA
jgi:CRISPR-associated protein Cmr4